MLPKWVADYVGLPYKLGGRTREEGVDCWGLVRLVHLEQWNREIPAFNEATEWTPELGGRLIDEGKPLVDTTPIDPDAKEIGDLLVLQIAGHPAHVALYVGGGYLLQTSSKNNSTVESLTSPAIAKRIEGFYRVKN